MNAPEHKPSPNLADRDVRERIAHDLETTLFVEAAAGTGKTTCMVRRMVALVAQGACAIDKMAAVTFTRKAAAQLRDRFQSALVREHAQAANEAERARLSAGLAHVDRCFIGTIHSFCGRLLRERPVEAGVDLAFVELDEEHNSRLVVEAWERYVESLLTHNDPILGELDEVGLQIGQLKDAFLTLAEFPDVADWHETKVAIGEGERQDAVRALEAYVGHMQDMARGFGSPGKDTLMPLYQRIPRTVRHADLTVLPDLLGVLEAFKHKETKHLVQKNWPGGREQALKELKSWNEFVERTAEPLQTLWLTQRYEVAIRAARPALLEYERLKHVDGALSFQDLLMKAAALLGRDETIRRYFRRRYSHVLVDEFQDTDPLQAEVLLLLTADDPKEKEWRSCRPVPGSLFVVGDPKQSIYRFRRADIEIYSQVKEIITSSGGEVLTLLTNFRTLRPLIEWVNATFEKVFKEGAPAHVALEPRRDDGASAILKGLRTLTIPEGYGKKEDILPYEVEVVTRTIHEALGRKQTVALAPDGGEEAKCAAAEPGHFIILTAKRKNLTLYATALQRLGIPHQVTGGAELNEVEELALLSTCVRAALDPANALALVAALRSALFGFSDAALLEVMSAVRASRGRLALDSALPAGLKLETAERLRAALAKLKRYRAWMRKLAPVAAIERIAADLGLIARACARECRGGQAGSLAKAFELLRRREPTMPTVAELSVYLADLVEQEEKYDGLPARPQTQEPERDMNLLASAAIEKPPPQVQAPVLVMNLHKAKGLEAPVVFLADPTGEYDPGAARCIDRSTNPVTGYMAITERFGEHGSRLLAVPERWNEICEREEKALLAERLRLFYVAATRAGSQMVLSRRITKKGVGDARSPWSFFEDHLGDHFAPLEPPAPVAEPADAAVAPGAISRRGPHKARQRIRECWRKVERPSYKVEASKAAALARAGQKPEPAKARRTTYGKAIHALIEAKIRRPEVDLEACVKRLVEEKRLKEKHAGEVVQAVEGLLRSALGERIGASSRRLSEVPFRRLHEREGKPPTVEHGVIDLAFRERAGWVLVDFKTYKDAAQDEARARHIERDRHQLDVYARAWRELSGEAVAETGLYFTAARQYEPVSR